MSALSVEQQSLVDELAERVVRHRLAVPAMMLLETFTPMNMLGSSTLHMASPLWRIVVPASRIDQAARLLEHREAIPALISAIDICEESRRRAGTTPEPPTSRRTP